MEPRGLRRRAISLFGFGLGRDPTLIPSPLVGTAAPDFRLAELDTAVYGVPVTFSFTREIERCLRRRKLRAARRA